jgi:hypothetical protein
VLSAVAAGAVFGATPTVIDPSTGASVWSYSDAADVTAKREGGYLEFNRTGGGYAADGSAYSSGFGFVDQSGYVGRGPHGGYDTSTNKCNACHGVHRGEGVYYLTRADSQDDACVYCHGPDSTGSSTPVYTGNPGGIHTQNGHTIGAGTSIPSSSVSMEVEEIELIEGRADTAVQVRSYVSESKRLYRLVNSSYGAAGHPSTGGATAYVRVGPTPLSCSSCHHVHGASAQIWRPTAYDSTYATDQNGFLSSGYKLLRRFPGATAVGDPAPGVSIEPADLAKVPESRLIPDFNFSTRASLETTYTENGETFRQPDWVIQRLSGGADGSAAVVNQFTLSVWCADCHNLAIGGGSHGSNEETGSPDPHSDSTHPIPGSAALPGATGGGSQCYTCHRNDLGRGSACSQCHYATAEYRLDAPASDFPHSGSDDSVRLLGAFSIEVSPDAQRWSDFAYVDTTVTETNLDAVCLRCHAVKHADYGSGSSHDVPAEYEECTACHTEGNAADIHTATDSGCNACHAAAVLTFDCGTCHPAQLEPHGYELADHAATPGSGQVMIFPDRGHDDAGWAYGQSPPHFVVTVDCAVCHATDLGAVHGGQCSTCHPAPVESLGTWDGSCQQGGCHLTYHADSSTAHEPWEDPYSSGVDCDLCHLPGVGPVVQENCANCHTTYSATDTSPPSTSTDAIDTYVGPAIVKFSITDNGKVGVGTTFYRLDGGPVDSGPSAFVPELGTHSLEYWSVDQNGNVETVTNTVVFTVTADTIAPVTTSNAGSVYYTPVRITLTATDASTLGVKATYYTLNGGPVQTGTSVYVPQPASGTVAYTLTFWSEDWAGNTELPKTAFFTVTGGTGIIRLVWGGGPPPPGADASWTIRRGGPSGYIVTTGSGGGAGWDGIDDIVLPVSGTAYYVEGWWYAPSIGFDEPMEFFDGSPYVFLTSDGQIEVRTY